MKNLALNFQQRLGLSSFLMNVSGPLGKMSALQRILDCVRFTDEEMRQITVADVGNGRSTYTAPQEIASFGALETQIEDADAGLLQQEIDGCQNFHITDLKWVEAVKAQLSAASVTGKKRK